MYLSSISSIPTTYQSLPRFQFPRFRCKKRDLVSPQKGFILFLIYFILADVQFFYCPSTTGCRTIVLNKENTGQKFFRIADKYTLTFYFNEAQKGAIYLDAVIAVPLDSFNDAVLKPLPLELATEFVQKCADANYQNHPSSVSKYCSEKIFSVSTDFNGAGLPCDCSPGGKINLKHLHH